MIIYSLAVGGVFTPTESAAVACVYAFLVTFFRHFWYREVPLRRFLSILYATMARSVSTVCGEPELATNGRDGSQPG